MKKIKKILIFILIVIITSIFWNIPRIKYDVNRDGKVGLMDMIEVQKYYMGH